MCGFELLCIVFICVHARTHARCLSLCLWEVVEWGEFDG